jgi:hypothetical protein
MSRKTRRRFRKGGPNAGPPPQVQASAPRGNGLVNAPLRDNVLRAAEQKVESQLTPENRANYLKVVVAGLKVGLQGGPNSILASIRNSQDPVRDCALGAVNLALMLAKESRYTMPPQAMVPAAMTLMLHALDFVDRAGIAKVSVPELNRATHVFTNRLLAVFKVSPQVLTHLSHNVHGIMQDPASMEMLARRAGVVRSPLASTPTAVPRQADQTGGGDNGV